MSHEHVVFSRFLHSIQIPSLPDYSRSSDKKAQRISTTAIVVLCTAFVINFGIPAKTCAQSGIAWKKVLDGYAQCVAIHPADPRVVYARSGGQLYSSTDGGDSWTPGAKFGFRFDNHFLVVHPTDSSIFMGVNDNGNFNLYRSKDSGTTFEKVLNSCATVDGGLLIDPLHPDTMYLSGGFRGFYESVDRGSSWKCINTSFNFFGAPAIRPDSTNILYCAIGFEGNIAKTTDRGLHWRIVQSQYPAQEISRIQVVDVNPLVAYAATDMVPLWKTTDGGESWSQLSLTAAQYGYHTWTTANQLHPERLYYSNEHLYPKVQRSLDDGQSWVSWNGGLSDAGALYGVFVANTDEEEVFVAGSDGVYKACPGASIYVDTRPDFSTAGMRISTGSRRTIYLAPVPGEQCDKSIVLMSEGTVPLVVKSVASNNPRFVIRSFPGTIIPGMIDSIVYRYVLPVDNPTVTDTGTVFLLTNSAGEPSIGIRLLINTMSGSGSGSASTFTLKGARGKPVTLPFTVTNLDTASLVIDFISANLPISQKPALPVTVPAHQSLSGQVTVTMPADPSKSVRAVLTIGGGISFQVQFPYLVDLAPESYSLGQNYPNPFNAGTRIQYSLPIDERVELSVFDVLGRKVTTIVDQVQPGGYYNVSFDGVRLSSGIYFYQMKTSHYVRTRKLVLLK